MAKRGPEDRSAKKTIVIVDDHPVLRRGLASLIEAEPDLAVGGEAANPEEAIETTRKIEPDLVIVDLELGRNDGLELVKHLTKHHPKIPALVLSMHEEEVYAERSLRAGARGYLSKQKLDETILVAIRQILAGRTYMSKALEARMAAKFVAGGTLATDSAFDALSDRELQVFRLIGTGQGTRQVAKTLGLSAKTIESHREHIKAKLNLETASELAQRAAQWVETGRTE